MRNDVHLQMLSKRFAFGRQILEHGEDIRSISKDSVWHLDERGSVASVSDEQYEKMQWRQAYQNVNELRPGFISLREGTARGLPGKAAHCI